MPEKMNVLVTGGAGYIGSHTVLQLLVGGYKTVVVDNLDNSSDVALKRVKELAGEHGSRLTYHKVSFCVPISIFPFLVLLVSLCNSVVGFKTFFVLMCFFWSAWVGIGGKVLNFSETCRARACKD